MNSTNSGMLILGGLATIVMGFTCLSAPIVALYLFMCGGVALYIAWRTLK